jgi:hypothetical protein
MTGCFKWCEAAGRKECGGASVKDDEELVKGNTSSSRDQLF